jgi:hypothetical protein
VRDSGLKALTVDSGMPVPWRLPGATYLRPSDEDGNFDVAAVSARPGRGTSRCWCPATVTPP